MDEVPNSAIIGQFSRFKALAIMKNKIRIVLGQNLGIYVCLAGLEVRDELEEESIARRGPTQYEITAASTPNARLINEDFPTPLWMQFSGQIPRGHGEKGLYLAYQQNTKSKRRGIQF